MYVLTQVLFIIATLAVLGGLVILVLWLIVVYKMMKTEVEEDKISMSQEELRMYAREQFNELKKKHPEISGFEDVSDDLFPRVLKDLLKREI